MPIDYVLEYPCEPKRRFGRDGLLDRLRRLQPRPGFGEREVDEAREVGFQLRPVAFHCVRCPANHARRSFGCYGAMVGPIDSEAEHWLIGLLPGSLKDRRGDSPGLKRQRELVRELIRRVGDLRVTGRAADERRGAGGAIPASSPAYRTYGSLFRPARITSSHLLHLLLFREQVEPPVAELACRALGVWTEDRLDADGQPEVVFAQPLDSDDHPSVADLKEFLYALVVACSLEVSVRTEVRAEYPPGAHNGFPARG